jgi:hypothetical protein
MVGPGRCRSAWLLHSANGGGTINEADFNGTDPRTLITGQNAPLAVTVGGSYTCWTTFEGDTINKANLNGGNQQTLVTARPLEVVHKLQGVVFPDRDA